MILIYILLTHPFHARDQCIESMEVTAENDEQANSEPEKIFLDYLSRTYDLFLDGDDNFEEMEQDMRRAFDNKNEWTKAEIARLEAEHAELAQVLGKMKSEPVLAEGSGSECWWSHAGVSCMRFFLSRSQSPLVKYQEESRAYAEDIVKVQKWIESLSAKQVQITEQVLKLKQESDVKGIREVKTSQHNMRIYSNMPHTAAELAAAEKEMNALQEVVDNQEISPADVDRMHAERDQLSAQLAQFTEKEDLLKHRLWENEVASQKKLDQVGPDAIVIAFP